MPLRSVQMAGAGALAACCLWLLFGVHEKLAFAGRMGERTAMFHEQMARWYNDGSAPLAGRVACVAVTDEADSGGPYYSVFKMADNELLRYMPAWLEHQLAVRLGRPGRPVEHGQCQVVIGVDGKAVSGCIRSIGETTGPCLAVAAPDGRLRAEPDSRTSCERPAVGCPA